MRSRSLLVLASLVVLPTIPLFAGSAPLPSPELEIACQQPSAAGHEAPLVETDETAVELPEALKLQEELFVDLLGDPCQEQCFYEDRLCNRHCSQTGGGTACELACGNNLNACLAEC